MNLSGNVPEVQKLLATLRFVGESRAIVAVTEVSVPNVGDILKSVQF